MGWQWHLLDHMQIICTSLQTDNHASTSPFSFYRPDALLAAQPTASKHWKALQFFLPPSVFWCPRGSWPKFTNIGPDIQQGPVYQSAKFHPLLTTRLRDSCCQSLSISMTVWLTNNSKWYVSIYYVATKSSVLVLGFNKKLSAGFRFRFT